MKFCYLDESGMSGEPILVMAGVIVDATRMHITKNAWKSLLKVLSNATGRNISEFHSRKFYKGNGQWRTINGRTRAHIIEAILEWIDKRRHKITFSAVKKDNFNAFYKSDEKLKDLGSLWCTVAVHTILSIQKAHMHLQKNKGHTVLVFDRQDREQNRLTKFILNPPVWTRSYYGDLGRRAPFNQIVDVPYFTDSSWAVLIQVADLIAYILRTYAEIREGLSRERYPNEARRMEKWVRSILNNTLPRSSRYPSKNRFEAAQLFWDLAPESLRM